MRPRSGVYAADSRTNKRMREIFHSPADRLGPWAIGAWRLPGLGQRCFLNQAPSRNSADRVLDVGANIGQYRRFLRLEAGYKSHGISFEPQPACVAELNREVSTDPLWQLAPIALGAEESRSTLHEMKSSVFSSLLEPDDRQVPELSSLNRTVRNHEVTVYRLDQWVKDRMKGDLPEAIFLKLDTQGFDLEVSAGSRGILNRIVAIQTEASVLPIYTGMPDISTTLSVLRTAGFCPAASWPVTHDRALRAVEFDLLFINNAFAERIATPAQS